MLKWFQDIASDNAKKVLGGGLVAVALGFFAWAWLIVEGSVKAFIVRTAVEDLSKEDGALPVALKATLTKIRQSDVGALTVGNFQLTAANRSFTLYVYFPDGYKGKIFYSLKGDIIPRKRYVVLAPPNSKPIPLKQDEDSIILEKYFQPTSGQAALLDDIFEKSASTHKFQNNLRAITFQLEGTDSNPDTAMPDKAKLTVGGPNSQSTVRPLEIEISYVVLITPTIQLGP